MPRPRIKSRRIVPLMTMLAVIVIALANAGAARADGHVLLVQEEHVYVDMGSIAGVDVGSRLTLHHEIIATNPVTQEQIRDFFVLGQLTVSRIGDRVAVAWAPIEFRHRIRVGDRVSLTSEARKLIDPWQQRLEVAVANARAARRRAAALADPIGQARARAQAQEQEATAAITAWRATLGKPPEERVVVWRAYLQAHGDSPYASAVKREQDRLFQYIQREIEEQRQAAKRSEALARPNVGGDAADSAANSGSDRHSGDSRSLARERLHLASRLSTLLTNTDAGASSAMRRRQRTISTALESDDALVFSAPKRVYQGESLTLAFVVLRPELFENAWLYYRRRGDIGYQRVQLRHDGDAYLRGQLPSAAVNPPGIEYFVEASDQSQRPLLRTQDAPGYIGVMASVTAPEPVLENRSRVTIFTDYVDFDGGLGGGYDQYVHAEVDFMYRFYRPIYAVRIGFGTMSGIGGPKDSIDESPTEDCRDQDGVYGCRRIDFTYAYTEFEYRFSNTFAIMLRPQVGQGSNDIRPNSRRGRCDSDDELSDCELFRALGLQARIRLGDERDTNLTLAMGITQNVGALFEAAYTWSVIEPFPIKLAAQVTDQPVPEDFGVRLIADIGWRAYDWVYPSLRLAYQARDADHAGFSGGLAANFDW